MALAGCPLSKELPGDVDMGVWGLHAEPTLRVCGLEEVTGAALDFEGTLRGDSHSTQAWVTFEHYARSGSWDGAVFRSTQSAPRIFSKCACPTSVKETIELALLSASQAAAVGGQCPAEPFDGGVPAADPDAGLQPPGPGPQGFDAQLACGRLSTVTRTAPMSDGGSCQSVCEGCAVFYVLSGARR